MDQIIRLNYGCDETRLPGYIGIDVRPSVGADFVLPAWDTSPWQPDSVEEIYSRHMLEHLDPVDARCTLRAWFKVLRSGGLLRLVVPDLEFHARQLLGMAARWPDDPQRDLAHAIASFYGWREDARGGQDEDAHRWGYTCSSICDLLSCTGFMEIERITSGKDSEPWHLQVTARKPRNKPKTIAQINLVAGQPIAADYAREHVRAVLGKWRGSGKIAVFGAGRHTRKVLPALEDHAGLIAGIADDSPRSRGQRIGRWNVMSPGECIGPNVSGILVSSDVQQEHIEARLRAEYAGRYEIITLYARAQSGGRSFPTHAANLEVDQH